MAAAAAASDWAQTAGSPGPTTVRAAAGGTSGTGQGGSNGGGGGADGSNGGGAGGGVGGTAGTRQHNGGGGYGGDVNGGNGGFGGGGGGSLLVGGNGGFGGGSAFGFANSGAPGFGGGSGAGGGLGAGADVFVQQGGSLNIVGGTLGSGTVTGGNRLAGYGTNGLGLGSSLFIQGSQSVTLGALANTTLDIAGTIADEAGNGGSAGNKGALVIDNNAGTVELDAVNSYAGGTVLDGGTFLLSSSAIAGGGAITFGAGKSATLAFSGASLANRVIGFAIGDTIDLVGAGLETGFPPNASNDFTFTGGTHSVSVQFDGTQDFSPYALKLTSDGTGLADSAINDNQTVEPFSNIVLTDLNAVGTEKINISWNTADGTLTDGATTHSTAFSVSGTTADVQTELRNLVFTPTANQVAPGNVVPTTFQLSDTNGGQGVTTASTKVSVTSVNYPAMIGGTATGTVVENGFTKHPTSGKRAGFQRMSYREQS